MKKLLASLTTAAALVAFVAVPAFAGPASKFAVNVRDLTIVPATGGVGYTTVLSTTIKTPNKKDLLIGVSFETGLFTKTTVKSRNGATDTETATATLKVRVLVDNQQLNPEVAPKEVVYDHRLQTLSATLGGVISECTDTDDFSVVDGVCVDNTPGVLTPDGTITVQCECVVTDEIIELILDTMAAHHFNFVAKNLPPGDHTVQVQVQGTTSATSADAEATVTVGRGSLTVEEVRATNSPDGVVFEQ